MNTNILKTYIVQFLENGQIKSERNVKAGSPDVAKALIETPSKKVTTVFHGVWCLPVKHYSNVCI